MVRVTAACLTAGLTIALHAWSAPAQTVTPTAGQSAEQVTADQAVCANQATAASGYSPSAPPAAAVQHRPVGGQRIAGAAQGATLGAIRENRTTSSEREVDDLTESAARAGAVAGGVRQRTERRFDRREAQTATAADSQRQAAYTQSFSGCMTAKGYSVQ